MKRSIKLALVGAGYWGKNLARNFDELGVLHSVCDPSEEVRAEQRKRNSDLLVTESFSDLLAQPEISAVAIATPAVMHFSMARDALLAGKHVFVEKPLALSVEEGETLVRIAREKNRVLFVGHILHYHPAIRTLKDLIHSGELGKIQYIYSNRLNLGKIRREENILWSFAPHDISIILSLMEEEPEAVQAMGSNVLHPNIADSTLTHLRFPSGVSAHIFVSWLNPFKEQKLVVTGDRQMVVFDDTLPRESKLTVYPHQIRWQGSTPVSEKKEGRCIDLSEGWEEPLLSECRAFLSALDGAEYVTDGDEGLRVLRVLERAQKSLSVLNKDLTPERQDFFVHETSRVDENCQIGAGTKIWHYSHVLPGTVVGEHCNIGQNVMIGPNGQVGSNVKIQNNVSVYEGVILEDNVFCGPSCVFTNVINPRSAISRRSEFKTTRVGQGASIGANASILCGVSIGQYAFIGMGTTVLKDVPDHALVCGNPGKIKGWVCKCGVTLDASFHCPACGNTYPKLQKSGSGKKAQDPNWKLEL